MPTITVPGQGDIAFPDEMAEKDIVAAIEQNFFPQKRMERLRSEGAKSRGITKGIELAETVADTVARGPANAVAAVGHSARRLGELARGAAVDVMAGNVFRRGFTPDFNNLADAAAGRPLRDEADMHWAEKGLADAAQMIPTIGIGTAVGAASGNPAVPFAALMGSEAYEASGGNVVEGAKGALTGAVMPGVGAAGRKLAANALGRAVGKGLLSGNSTLALKAAEAMGSQATIQAMIEGMNIPTYMSLPKEERKELFLRSLIANTAFLGLDARHVLGRGPSATSGTPGMTQKRVAEVVKAVVADAPAADALRQQVDQWVIRNFDPNLPAEYNRKSPELGQETSTGQEQTRKGGEMPAETGEIPAPPDPGIPLKVRETAVKPAPVEEIPQKQVSESPPTPSEPAPIEAPAQLKSVTKLKIYRQPTDRPPDIIDDLMGLGIKIRSPKAARPGSEGYYGEAYKLASKRGAVRQVITSSQDGVAPDEAVDILRRNNVLPEDAAVDDLWDMLDHAANSRIHQRGEAKRQAQDAKAEVQQMKKAQDFDAAAKGKRNGRQPKAGDPIPVDNLYVGDEFELQGVKVRVKDQIINHDTGEIDALILEDGRRFGVQTVDMRKVIRPDEGTLEQVDVNTDFLPPGEEMPAPATPQPEQAPQSPIIEPENPLAPVNPLSRNDRIMLKRLQNFQGKRTQWQEEKLKELEARAGQEKLPLDVPQGIPEEVKQAQAKKARAAAVAEKQHKRLVGTSGDVGQGDLLQSGGARGDDLFAPRPPGSGRNASFGRYDDGSPVEFGHLDLLRPVEMPELVRLVTGWLGSPPIVKRLSKAHGYFQDLGGNKGKIALNRDLFADPTQVVKTMAHEIGHLADWLGLLPRTLDRGNLLGRLGSMVKWLAHTFPKMPGPNAFDELIKPKDRRGFRIRAENEVGPRPPRDNVTDLELWRAEVSRRYREIVSEEIEARGLVALEPVAQEAYNLSVEWRPLPENPTDSHLAYRKSSREIYADMVSVLFNSPGLLQRKAPQFWELFANWLDKKPEFKRDYLEIQKLLSEGPEAVGRERMAAGRRMFQRGEQILADAIEQKRLLRETWKGTWEQFRRQAVDMGDALTRAVIAVRATGERVPSWMDPREAWEKSLFMDNRNMLDFKFVWENVLKPIEDAGVDRHDLGLWVKWQRDMGNIEAYETARDLEAKLRADKAEGKELDPAEVEDWKAARRAAGSRAFIGNPGGYDPYTARASLDALKAKLGDRAPIVAEAADKFRALVFERVAEGHREGIFSDETFYDTILPNKKWYVAYRGLDHIDTYVSPTVRRALGTLSDQENPFYTTLLKMQALNNLIYVQRAKNRTRDFMRRPEFDGTWMPAEPVWDGAKRVPRTPAEGYERLSMLEDGKLVHYDVDPAIAEAFTKLAPREISVITKMIDWPFSKIVYPLIIKYNPGFLFALNPIRDFKRSARNLAALSGMGRTKLLRAYARNFNRARAYVKGSPDALGELMLETAAIGTPMEGFTQLDRRDPMGEFLRRYRILAAPQKSKLLRGLLWVPKRMEQAGMIMEALPKFAGYELLLRDPNNPSGPAETAAKVRNYIGTPNYRVKGAHGNVHGVLIPFLNIFMQGYRSDFRLARRPTTRGGWWFSYMLHDGSKAVLQALATAGIMGPVVQELMEGASEYDRSNYTVFPLGYQRGAGEYAKKLMYLRIPRDETARLVSAGLYKITKLAADAAQGKAVIGDVPKSMQALFDVGAGIVPTVTPILQIADAWKDYAQNLNPIDPWRNQPVIGRLEFEAGGLHGLPSMLTYTADKLGALNFFRYDAKADSTTELKVSGTPILNRMVKISDYGYVERQNKSQDLADQMRARHRLNYGPIIREKLVEYARLREIPEAARTPEQARAYQRLNIWYSAMYRSFDEAVYGAYEAGERAQVRALQDNFTTQTEQLFEGTAPDAVRFESILEVLSGSGR